MDQILPQQVAPAGKFARGQQVAGSRVSRGPKLIPDRGTQICPKPNWLSVDGKWLANENPSELLGSAQVSSAGRSIDLGDLFQSSPIGSQSRVLSGGAKLSTARGLDRSFGSLAQQSAR